MKSLTWQLLAVIFSLHPAYAVSVDWSQPPVGCAEKMIPTLPDRPCLDLSHVADPYFDWPANLSPSELQYWKIEKEPILYCRALEVQKREKSHPGSFSEGQIEYAWLQTLAVEHSNEKISAVYEASLKQKIPTQILTGAIEQESVFAELGISEDGGNYSCGIGQGSIIEWCHWVSQQDLALKSAVGWPEVSVDCDSLQPRLIEPFYKIAKTRLGTRPEYQLNAHDFWNISFETVQSQFPSASEATQLLWFQISISFIENCSDAKYGIAAKANELALLYQNFVPSGLKSRDAYPPGERFKRKCQEEGFQGAYPLNQAWLLAVGIYNSGPRAVDALAYYNQWNQADLRKVSTWDQFTPQDMINSFYWSGKYNLKTDEIDFTNLENKSESWIWFKPCVLQRHIARVIQHVTEVGQPNLVESLDGDSGCEKSVFDPATGGLIHSAVPRLRQISSGHRKLDF